MAKAEHPEVLHDERIDTGAGCRSDGFCRSGHLTVGDEGIERQVDLNAADMAEAHRLGQLLDGKVPRTLPRIEARQPEIHRVRTVADGGSERIEGAGGG